MSEPAAREWQSRPEAGGRVALWLLRNLPFVVGRTGARLITRAVAFYFLVRRGPERAASRVYLTRIFGRRPRLAELYRHFLTFSWVTLDRVYLMVKGLDAFDVRVIGIEPLEQALAARRGCLLLSAHLGSFDALRVLAQRRPDLSVRILIDIGQNAELSRVLNSLDPALASTIIDARKPGPALVLEMQEALQGNAIVSTLADRLRPGNPQVSASFLGSPAPFPASPWMLAGALRVPVVLAFGLYLGGRDYELHFEAFDAELPAERGARQAALGAIVQRFADRLEHFARLAPYNWFNLYDFWNGSDAAPANSDRARAADDGPAASR